MSIRVVAFDVETWLIVSGMLAPKLVCGSFAEYPDGLPAYDEDAPTLPEPITRLYAREQALDELERLLDEMNTILIMHNGPYDMAVAVAERPRLLGLIFAAYEDGRIRDTLSRDKLYRIAKGEHEYFRDRFEGNRVKKTEFSLQALVWRWFGFMLPKTDTWRLRYSELDGVPVEQYPEDAAKYALGDASWTLKVFVAQCSVLEPDETDVVPTFPDEVPQVCAMWALHLMSMWGLRTNPETVGKLKAKYEKLISSADEALKSAGILRKDGTRDMKAFKALIEEVCEERGLVPPRTPTGEISTEGEFIKSLVDEDCEHLENPAVACSCSDPVLHAYSDSSYARWVMSSWMPILIEGTKGPINPRYQHLLETGRTACEKPNAQNLPRKGNVRDCFEPRKGHVFVGADFDTIELATWAQACWIICGFSEMREALIQGKDPHLALAADMLGLSYEEAKKRYDDGDVEVAEMRQNMKIPNFGHPGGMTAKTLMEYAAGFGVKLTFDQAQTQFSAWKKKWPENKPYFKHVQSIIQGGGVVQQLMTGRIRGGVTYTSCANGYFQGLAADGAKRALWAVTCECYLEGYDLARVRPGLPFTRSPLFGSRPTLFIHDEIIMETPENLAHEAAMRLKTVMIEEMKIMCPDVPIKASPVITRRWLKGAKPAFVFVDGQKRMVPAKAEKYVSEDGKDKVRWVPDLGEFRYVGSTATA